MEASKMTEANAAGTHVVLVAKATPLIVVNKVIIKTATPVIDKNAVNISTAGATVTPVIEADNAVMEETNELDPELPNETVNEVKRRWKTSGKVIHSSIRKQILEFAAKLDGKNNEYGVKYTKNDIARNATKAFGISEKTFYKIMKEGKNAELTGETIVTPGKKRNRPCSVRDTFDGFMQDAVRRKIYILYTQHVYPTLHNLLQFAKDELGFEGKRSTFAVILPKMGFKYKKFNGRLFLMEKHDVKLLRHMFLSKWRKFKDERRFFVYLDETWVSQNMVQSSVCQSNDGHPQKTPSGKGKGIVLLHAGGDTGFIPNCLLTFLSNSGLADYHKDMNSDVFEKWFGDQLLQNIPPKSVIVLDNAPYHSVLLEKLPTSNTRKAQMVDWLMQNGIHVDENAMSKVQLYEIIRKHKPTVKKYRIDEMARNAGHDVLRLPPHHCQFNPMEHIWDIVKPAIAKRNKAFKVTAVQNLIKECIMEIRAEVWAACIKNADDACEDYWNLDLIVEEHVEELIFQTGAISSDTSDEDTDGA